MNERKPTWNCPICDSKAAFDTLLIDGYFQTILESTDLPKDENDITLERVSLVLIQQHNLFTNFVVVGRLLEALSQGGGEGAPDVFDASAGRWKGSRCCS
jgi:hypothetical protein